MVAWLIPPNPKIKWKCLEKHYFLDIRPLTRYVNYFRNDIKGAYQKSIKFSIKQKTDFEQCENIKTVLFRLNNLKN